MLSSLWNRTERNEAVHGHSLRSYITIGFKRSFGPSKIFVLGPRQLNQYERYFLHIPRPRHYNRVLMRYKSPSPSMYSLCSNRVFAEDPIMMGFASKG